MRPSRNFHGLIFADDTVIFSDGREQVGEGEVCSGEKRKANS